MNFGKRYIPEFTMGNMTFARTVLCAVIAVITIAVCIVPMGDLPIWNGQVAGHRNQYELMAEALLDGKIELDYGDTEGLESLENPYDPEERKQSGVKYHWDHAYYEGHYYMYFGIVPVLLLFLPYRVITGEALTTFHGTQVFTAIAIAGIFMLFYRLSRRFFPKLHMGLYLCLSAAFSVMSFWYASAEPALYCTAITAAVALEIWSIYFFVWAVWGESRENRQILLAAVGALLGALVFGCRPTVALANVLVIPMLAVFLRGRKFSLKLFGKLAAAASPYVIVGVCLMLYNYVRFADPFEFGQAYQLTVADQTGYSISLNFSTVVRLVNESGKNFFAMRDISTKFPYIRASSVFFNFPILLLGVLILRREVFSEIRKHKLLSLVFTIVGAVLLITAFSILWTPYLLERYRMDIYFLIAIGCFTVLGFSYSGATHKKLLGGVIVAFCLMTLVSSYLLYVQTVGVYYPEKVAEMQTGIFGIF